MEKNFKIHGRTPDAIRKTIEECIRDGILIDYLKERHVEVTRIMHEMLTQETALRMHDLQFEKKLKAQKAGFEKKLKVQKNELDKKDSVIAKQSTALEKKDGEIKRLKEMLKQLQAGKA